MRFIRPSPIDSIDFRWRFTSRQACRGRHASILLRGIPPTVWGSVTSPRTTLSNPPFSYRFVECVLDILISSLPIRTDRNTGSVVGAEFLFSGMSFYFERARKKYVKSSRGFDIASQDYKG
eukprot:scaffold2058_cov115-Cylindrotheca_fusiformis.AAC.4